MSVFNLGRSQVYPVRTLVEETKKWDLQCCGVVLQVEDPPVSIEKCLGQNVLYTVHLDLKSKRYDFKVRAPYSGNFGQARHISVFRGRPPQPMNRPTSTIVVFPLILYTLRKGCSIGVESAYFLSG